MITHTHTHPNRNTHPHKHRQNVPGPLQTFTCFLCVLSLSYSGGMFVDQCVSEAVICLAAALPWVGRWSGYPYPPSGHPGMEEMWSWPRAEQDQGIIASPSIQAICTGLSNNEHTLVISSRTIIKPAFSCPSLIQAYSVISAPEPGVKVWSYWLKLSDKIIDLESFGLFSLCEIEKLKCYGSGHILLLQVFNR